MKNLLHNTLTDEKRFCVIYSEQSLEVDVIYSTRKLRIKCNEMFSLGIYTGKYLETLTISEITGSDYQQVNSGIVTLANVQENFFEVGLFVEMDQNAFFSDDLVGELSPFKIDFKNENLRKSKRVSIRREDGIQLKVKYNGLELIAKVYDLSSFGFSFISTSKFTKGMNVGFEVGLRDGDFTGKAEVAWVQSLDGKFKTGLRFIGFDGCDFLKCKNQIVIKDRYFIHGIYSKINFYMERAEFKVLSLSNESFVLQIEKTDQYLLPGMKLDLKFFLSTMSFDDIIPTTATICFIEQGPNGTLIVGCNVTEISENLSLNLSNYLLQFLDVTPEEVRSAGFNVSKIADVFTFRYVETHSDYIEVLKLRYDAYLNAGKVDETKRPRDMTAGLDSKSRILIVKHQGKLIASAAISFPDSNEVVLDTEKALKNGFTKDIPAKTSMIEISRLCTHPSYRKGDLLHRIFEHIYKIFVVSGREHIITSCDDKLWPLYAKLGFYKTGLSYNHLALSGLLHHIIIVPIEVGLKVNKISLVTWSYLYSGMYQDLESKNIVKVNPYYRIKMKLGDVFLFVALRAMKFFSKYKNKRR